ncbi:unnamed protein product [Linum tenue]|nr:unnamed protein product [Linum tenue]CAI0561093.1 unnamed protein product [Linum tenue]
MLLRVA